MERKTLSVTEAAQVLGISRAYAYQMAREGKLPGCKRIGNRFVVSVKLLDEFIDSPAVHYFDSPEGLEAARAHPPSEPYVRKRPNEPSS